MAQFTRRDALRYLLGTAVAATLDVEKLLWIPKSMIVVPGPPVLDMGLVEITDLNDIEFDDWSTFGHGILVRGSVTFPINYLVDKERG